MTPILANDRQEAASRVSPGQRNRWAVVVQAPSEVRIRVRCALAGRGLLERFEAGDMLAFERSGLLGVVAWAVTFACPGLAFRRALRVSVRHLAQDEIRTVALIEVGGLCALLRHHHDRHSGERAKRPTGAC